MARVERLSTAEDNFWRALMRITLSLSRRMDGDLRRAVGISANEYITLMSVSEAPGESCDEGPCHCDGLVCQSHNPSGQRAPGTGLLSKRGCAEDGRGCVASLTPAGLAKLKAASSVQVSRVRALLFDHVDPATTDDAAQALSKIATRLKTGAGARVALSRRPSRRCLRKHLIGDT